VLLDVEQAHVFRQLGGVRRGAHGSARLAADLRS
jgi:hypothetical protein